VPTLEGYATARCVGIVHDQRDLGAAEHDGVAALGLHASDHALEAGHRLGSEDARDQFVHDDAVDLVTLAGGRAQMLQPAIGELFRIDVALDQPPCAGQAEAPEASRRRFRGDHLGDVQPGQRRVRQHMVQRLVDRVVRADQEVGAARCQLAGGRQHERRHALQVSLVEAGDIAGERRRMHGDLRVGMRAEQGRTLRADGPIAERRSFRRAADDTDVTGHGDGSPWRSRSGALTIGTFGREDRRAAGRGACSAGSTSRRRWPPHAGRRRRRTRPPHAPAPPVRPAAAPRR